MRKVGYLIDLPGELLGNNYLFRHFTPEAIPGDLLLARSWLASLFWGKSLHRSAKHVRGKKHAPPASKAGVGAHAYQFAFIADARDFGISLFCGDGSALPHTYMRDCATGAENR